MEKLKNLKKLPQTFINPRSFEQSMVKRLLPLAAMEKILKFGGAERVSDKGKVALKEVLEEFAEHLAADAVKFALHAGRKTIKEEDVKLASKSLKPLSS